MGIKIDYTAYNGERCDYHSLVDIKLRADGTATAVMGAFRTFEAAKIRGGAVAIREYEVAGLYPNEGIQTDVYKKLAEHPDFVGGEAF
jgi:hypothetical protein